MRTKQHKVIQSHSTVMRMKWSRLFLVICPCPPCWSSVALNDFVGFLFLSGTPHSPARCHTCSSAARCPDCVFPVPCFLPANDLLSLCYLCSAYQLSFVRLYNEVWWDTLPFFFWSAFFLHCLFFPLPVFSSACFDSARRIWILCLVKLEHCIDLLCVTSLVWLDP